ncbi:hypothetical protein CDD82_531 [Ophiocordyceps australis]|uniref:Zn(2)-C6 fungal-type domain-containing protein n=1 Tax=Ophiocordyceps australis TaxID=1399860 RepID=A0A2C5YG24_9HYPO|nr:hypothetical protein CDD82_531 [Ophiocordyceps australis]
MVGVPGKYKGCETCRRRRVKCSNERPFCRNCLNGGRQCEGYERERVFITGTLETKGRVASHPKKSSSTKKPKTKSDEAAKGPIRTTEPLMSAWDDRVGLSSHSAQASVVLTALQTDLQAVQYEHHDDGATGFHLCLPDYMASELRPGQGQDDFITRAKCLARLGGVDETCASDPGYCAFLFQNTSTAEDDWVKSLGPKHFVSFPNHFYFVRLHRPLAIGFALLSRKPSFLSEHEWIWTPWKQHPKSLLDELLDIVLHLPSILGAVDNLLPLPITLARRLQAQDLLQSCLVLEVEFHQWLNKVVLCTADNQPAYWAEPAGSSGGGGGGEIPFENSYAFRDGLTGLMMVYYWMSQMIFHGCIESIHQVIFQPVVEDFPNMWPDLPSALEIDLALYQDGRALAADICRGLDAVLMGSTQPDLLLAPMTVALDFYRDINATCQDGVLEILWLEAFKRRLALKGQHIAGVLQGQRWVQVASY